MTDDQRINHTPEQVKVSLDEQLRRIEAENPELARRIWCRGMHYRRLIEQNPHPMYLSVPNPAWQAWMDAHKEGG